MAKRTVGAWWFTVLSRKRGVAVLSRKRGVVRVRAKNLRDAQLKVEARDRAIESKPRLIG